MKLELSLAEFLRAMISFFTKLSGENGAEVWTEFKKFLCNEPCRKGRIFGPLQFVKPVAKGEVLVGTDFIADSKELAKNDGKQTLGQEAYDFYKKKSRRHFFLFQT